MPSTNQEPPPTFADWATREVNRLLKARDHARTAAERVQYELQLAVLCGAADRYGRSLVETSEI